MAIQNIQASVSLGGVVRIQFDSTTVGGGRALVNYGPTSGYGQSASASSLPTPNDKTYVATFTTTGTIHFSCAVQGDGVSSDQVYVIPTPDALAADLVVTSTGSTSARLLWDVSKLPQGASFQLYRNTVNDIETASAVGAPILPGVGLFNDYGPLDPGTLYYYWLVQVL